MNFDSLFNIYGSEAFLDIIDTFDIKEFSEVNKKQSDENIIECDCKVVDDEESKLIEE